MSFSEDVKKELLAIDTRTNCCRKAMLFGLLYNAKHIEATHMAAVFNSCECAEIVSEFLGNNVEPRIFRSVRGGRRKYTVDFSSKSFSSFIFKISHEEKISDAAKFRCEDCKRAFLRGVIISYATLNDPAKGYHLEIPLSAENSDRLSSLFSFLTECGFDAKKRKTQRGESLYFKSNTVIADILNYAGAMKSSFAVTNTYIERDIRNNENRATNFVAKNISRSVNATQRQIIAINKLIAHKKLDKLPLELVETAYLRVENDDLSLSELALMHEPPISKSGLNHRLEKLCLAADELFENK